VGEDRGIRKEERERKCWELELIVMRVFLGFQR
jgi:hypothetical protein